MRPHSSEPPLLHLRIVEVAEHTLQLLQRADDALEIRGVVEGRRDVDQIAQLLGSETQLVKRSAGVLLVEGVAAAGDAPAQPPGPLPTHVGEEASGIRARPDANGADRSRNAASQTKPPITFAVQRLVKSGAPAPAPGRGTRSTRPMSSAWMSAPGEPCSESMSTSMSRGGPVRRPSQENSAEKCSTAVRRKHVLDLPEQRPRTPHGHTEIVEELGVETAAHARLVRHQDLEQTLMNVPRADIRQDRRQRGPRRAARRRVVNAPSCRSVTTSNPSGHASTPGRLWITGTSVS